MPIPLSCYWEPSKAAHLMALAHKEVGKPYLLGSEGPVDLMLATWDCSELVQHLLACVGVRQVTADDGTMTPIERFDGAGFQWAHCHQISLEDAIDTPGALLFIRNGQTYPDKPHHIGHVAISLGNGMVVEARGRAYGVVMGLVRASFNRGGKVRELYTPALVRIPEAKR